MQASNECFYIIGHRGAAGERFENSMDGFKHALTLDIDAIELDIREHSGELWVIHDHELERLTGKSGLFEMQPDIAEIRLKNGESVPTLKQVLDLCWGKMPLNIEIKSVENIGLLLDLLALYPPLEAGPGLPWILISSFNHQKILELRQSQCRWPLAPISCGVPIQVDALIKAIAPYSWHFDDDYIDFELIAQIRNQGLRTLVFTVNDSDHAKILCDQGIDGIFTDSPSTLSIKR